MLTDMPCCYEWYITELAVMSGEDYVYYFCC